MALVEAMKDFECEAKTRQFCYDKGMVVVEFDSGGWQALTPGEAAMKIQQLRTEIEEQRETLAMIQRVVNKVPWWRETAIIKNLRSLLSRS